MTADDAFLQAILENPDDDVPRLVYADWLEEHDQPGRAALIRLQCRRARMPVRPWGLEEDALSLRIETLRQQHSQEWRQRLDHSPPQQISPDFCRGFVEGVEAAGPWAADWFLSHAGLALEAAPLLSRVLLSWRILGTGSGAEQPGAMDRDLLGPFAALPALRRLRWLALNDARNLGAEGLGYLAASPYLTGLRHLSLNGSSIGTAAHSLLAAPWLAQLESLELGGGEDFDGAMVTTPRNSIGDSDVELLAASPALAGLKHLNLTGNYLGPAALRALAASPHLAGLVALTINFPNLRRSTSPDEEAARTALRQRFGNRLR
jgi:uncharacterized protein (TIGR02996 family)